MPDFQQSLTMQAPPDAVLAFVSDIRNLPRYVPTTKQAEPQGEERVHVEGDAQGHHYDADGYLRRRDGGLEWGADEGYYKGWLKVQPEGDGSAVTVGISLNGHPPGADPDAAPSEDDINEGLRKGLESIRNQVEGTGGKEEPSAAT
jgi:hypothetical protein